MAAVFQRRVSARNLGGRMALVPAELVANDRSGSNRAVSEQQPKPRVAPRRTDCGSGLAAVHRGNGRLAHHRCAGRPIRDESLHWSDATLATELVQRAYRGSRSGDPAILPEHLLHARRGAGLAAQWIRRRSMGIADGVASVRNSRAGGDALLHGVAME